MAIRAIQVTESSVQRLHELQRFYDLMDALRQRLNGPMALADATGRMNWPQRGVYFFFDPNEPRNATGEGPRVVRVGTHALNAGSGTKLWGRLSQHGGVRRTEGGNHRGSIFRLLVGEAMMLRQGSTEPRSWGVGGHAGAVVARLGQSADEIRSCEQLLEIKVSRYIRNLPFLFVAVDDAPGQDSRRGFIERNSIALLSNYHRPALDAPSAGWLGRRSGRDRVRESGLWNNNHVDEPHDASFLGVLEEAIAGTQPAR